MTLFELLTFEVPYKGLPDSLVQDFVLVGGRPRVPRAEDLPGADMQQVRPWRSRRCLRIDSWNPAVFLHPIGNDCSLPCGALLHNAAATRP